VPPGPAAAAPAPPDHPLPALQRDTAPLVPAVVSLNVANAALLAAEQEVLAARAGIICPVEGNVWFMNDFGDSRPGGRSHQGNDIASGPDQAAVAVVDGAVSYKSGHRQGRGAYLRGSDGNEYRYYHLNEYVGAPRAVKRGEVIGIVGNTGNAGGIHTHFEIHPGWSEYDVENPYDKLDIACRDRAPLH
jgi:murein DD-endopeptidase MepM/ murein hydrolase activator NlpD